MKAAQDFEICIDKEGNRVSNYSSEIPKDAKIHKFKVGEEVPNKFLPDLIIFNPDYLKIEYKDGKMILPKEVEVNKESKERKRKYLQPPKYTQESLQEKRNKLGWKKFREWAKEKFNTTDRSSSQLIVEILKIQEEKKEAGDYLE